MLASALSILLASCMTDKVNIAPKPKMTSLSSDGQVQYILATDYDSGYNFIVQSNYYKNSLSHRIGDTISVISYGDSLSLYVERTNGVNLDENFSSKGEITAWVYKPRLKGSDTNKIFAVRIAVGYNSSSNTFIRTHSTTRTNQPLAYSLINSDGTIIDKYSDGSALVPFRKWKDFNECFMTHLNALGPWGVVALIAVPWETVGTLTTLCAGELTLGVEAHDPATGEKLN